MTEKREIDDYLPSKREEDSSSSQKKVGCAECGYKGFILIEQSHSQPLFKRCRCYEEYMVERDKPQWGKKK